MEELDKTWNSIFSSFPDCQFKVRKRNVHLVEEVCVCANTEPLTPTTGMGLFDRLVPSRKPSVPCKNKSFLYFFLQKEKWCNLHDINLSREHFFSLLIFLYMGKMLCFQNLDTTQSFLSGQIVINLSNPIFWPVLLVHISICSQRAFHQCCDRLCGEFYFHYYRSPSNAFITGLYFHRSITKPLFTIDGVYSLLLTTS